MLAAAGLDNRRIGRTPETTAALYFCSDCGACQTACKHSVDVSATLRAARRQAVGAGSAPLRSDSINTPIETKDAAILPAGVSGVLLMAAGFDSAFERVAGAAVARWASRSEWCFESAEDARCVIQIFPTLGLQSPRAVSLAAHTAAIPAVDGPTAYYEAPQLRQCPELNAEGLRAQARESLGDQWVQWRGSGAESFCCGSSGTYPLVSPEGAADAARRVLRLAKTQGATHILTACGASAAHLRTYAAPMGLNVLSWGV